MKLTILEQNLHVFRKPYDEIQVFFANFGWNFCFSSDLLIKFTVFLFIYFFYYFLINKNFLKKLAFLSHSLLSMFCLLFDKNQRSFGGIHIFFIFLWRNYVQDLSNKIYAFYELLPNFAFICNLLAAVLFFLLKFACIF